jgi:hypothetical protein
MSDLSSESTVPINDSSSEGNFNYIDNLNSSATRAYYSDLADSQIESYGRKTQIFLLDKKATETDNLYKSEKYSRIYLPPFEQRANYATNVFAGTLNFNGYEEIEPQIDFIFAFDRMVHNIRNLKDKISGKLTIKNRRKDTILINIKEKKLILFADGKEIAKYDLKLFTIKQLVSELNKAVGIVSSYEGNDERADFFNHINNITIGKGKEKTFPVYDNTWANCTDVIEQGAVLVTNKFRAYIVTVAIPSNDDYNEYVYWNCKADLAEMSMLQGLPMEYRKTIEKHRYNLPKINLE